MMELFARKEVHKNQRQVIVFARLNLPEVPWKLFYTLDSCFVNKLPFFPFGISTLQLSGGNTLNHSDSL